MTDINSGGQPTAQLPLFPAHLYDPRGRPSSVYTLHGGNTNETNTRHRSDPDGDVEEDLSVHYATPQGGGSSHQGENSKSNFVALHLSDFPFLFAALRLVAIINITTPSTPLLATNTSAPDHHRFYPHAPRTQTVHVHGMEVIAGKKWWQVPLRRDSTTAMLGFMLLWLFASFVALGHVMLNVLENPDVSNGGLGEYHSCVVQRCRGLMHVLNLDRIPAHMQAFRLLSCSLSSVPLYEYLPCLFSYSCQSVYLAAKTCTGFLPRRLHLWHTRALSLHTTRKSSCFVSVSCLGPTSFTVS